MLMLRSYTDDDRIRRHTGIAGTLPPPMSRFDMMMFRAFMPSLPTPASLSLLFIFAMPLSLTPLMRCRFFSADMLICHDDGYDARHGVAICARVYISMLLYD